MRSRFLLLLALVVLAVPAFAGVAHADNPAPGDFAPAIWSDKADYMPGETVTLTGANWQPGETVHISVNDDVGSTWNRSTDVTADAAGYVTDTFQLPEWFVAQYSVRAEGASGVATSSFTDGNVTFAANPTSSGPLTVKYTRYGTGDCSGAGTTQPDWVTGNAAIAVNGANQSIKVTSITGAGGATPISVTLSGSTTNQTVPFCIDGTGNGSQVYNANFNADTTAPTVSSITRAAASPTNASSVSWNVTFSESVTGVDTGDFTLPASGVTGASITGVSGSGANYTVTASTGTGNGTIGLNLTDNDSIADTPAGNKLGGTGAGNGNFTGDAYTIDKTTPTVSSINRADASPTNAGSVNWTVTFSESVNNVDETDFVLARAGVTGGSITGVSGSGTTYTVSATTGTGDGTLGLNLVDDDTISDATNKLGGTGAGNGNFTGQLYTIDKTAPTVTSINRSASSPTNASSVSWDVTFSESVTGVDAGDFALAASGVTGASITGVTGSGSSYTVTASTGTGSGTLGLNLVDDDSIADAATNKLGGTGAGNGNFTGQVYELDRTNPVVTISLAPALPNGTNGWYTSQPTVTVSATDANISTLSCTVDGSPVTLTGTSSTSSSKSGTVPVSGQGSHTVACSATDTATNSGSDTKTYKLDSINPSVSVSLDPSSPDGAGGFYTADPAVTVAATDANPATTSCTVDGVSVTIGAGGTVPVSGDGTHTVDCSATDPAGNTGSDSETFKVDATDPTIDVALAPTSPNGANGWYKTQPDASVTASDANDVTTECTVDGNAVTVGSGGSVPVSGEGSHTISCTATDEAGNTASDSETYKLDSVDPEISLTLDPADPDGDNDYYLSAPDVTVASSDTNLDTTSCEVNGDAATIGAGGSVPIPSADGTYTVECTATDKAGNDATATKTFKVDGTAPTVDVQVTPASPSGDNGYYTSDPAVKVVANDAHLADVSCTVDGSGVTLGAGGSVPVSGDGSHTVSCTATDDAGNDASDSETFKVDSNAPSSSATSPPRDNDGSFTVDYTAEDTGTGASGLAKVELFVSKDGGASTPAGVDSAPGATGSFSFAGSGDGTYAFYTVATDKAGNEEGAPATADDETLVDSIKPESKATSPEFDNDGSIAVDYTASDDSSGLDTVKLYASKDSGAYTLAGTDSTPGATGSFTYSTSGDGTYAFYTVATDKAGNEEDAPSTADDETLEDSHKPSSTAHSPATDQDGSFDVTYDASDDAPSSGFAKVELWVKEPGAADYELANTDLTPHNGDAIPFVALAGEGTYRFYSIAYDKAGNVEDVQTDVDSTVVEDTHTVFDATAPVTAASVDALSKTKTLTVGYTANDQGTDNTGVSNVDLYVKTPGASSFTLADTDSAPGATGSFTYTAIDDGEYAFYTVGTDGAGNIEAKTTEDDHVLVDTAAPKSSASSPDYDNDGSIAVAWHVTDETPSSNVAKIELYAKKPGGSFALAGTVTDPAADGTFTYPVGISDPDGSYEFYTVATDAAGNEESTPVSADDSTFEDRAKPHSAATSPTLDNDGTFQVDYTAGDGAPSSGLAEVQLWVSKNGGAYTKFATDSSPSASGHFTFTGSGDGTYRFHTVAVDQAINTEDAPATADDETLVDSVKPESKASSPDFDNDGSIAVGYEASDDSPSSGLGTVKLYVSKNGGAYTLAGTDSTPGATGSFTYSTTGDGTYAFYTVATDKAGNTEDAPGTADDATREDSVDPASQAHSPATDQDGDFSVTYDASDADPSSGVDKVELYVKSPAAGSDYELYATDSSGTGTFHFVANDGEGTYRFYSLAYDKAGNVEDVQTDVDATVVEDNHTIVDGLAPVTNAFSDALSNSRDVEVGYNAADQGTDNSGLVKVELWVDGPAPGTTAVWADETTTASNPGSFTYHATADGEYRFFTVGIDAAGNRELDPALGDDTTTLIDTVKPVSSASSTTYDNDGSFDVGYHVTDADPSSQVAKIELFVKKPGAPTYVSAGSQANPPTDGTFSYTVGADPDGDYAFYTVATDKAGNEEDAPSSADDTTTEDRVKPHSVATSPTYDTDGTFDVTYTAGDDSPASGLDTIELFVSKDGGAYTSAGTQSASASGHFTFTGSGDGTYSFYTRATDKAGNVEAAPATADDDTIVDSVKPTSKANSPEYDKDGNFVVSYTANDPSPASGLDKVELWVKTPGGSSYTLAATDNAPAANGSFNYVTAGQGTYRFYTRSRDKAGNYELAPANPDDQVVVDHSLTLVDGIAPGTTDNVPTSYVNHDVTVTLTPTDGPGTDVSGVDKTYYEQGASPADPTLASSVYDPSNKPVLADGEKIKYFSTDKAGNVEAIKTSPAAKVDKLKPTTTDDVPTTWQNADVEVTLTRTDTGGSGVDKTYYEQGASPADPTTGSSVYDPSNKPTLDNGEVIKYFTVDNAGNAEDVKTSIPAKVDKIKPVVTVTTPARGGNYELGSTVLANFGCTDSGGSLLQTCVGPVANGTAVNTATVGTKTFNVDATDGAGNPTHDSGTYNVNYNWDGFLQPINDTAHQIGVTESKFKLGSTVPVKFQIKTAAGQSVQQSNALTFSKAFKGATCDPTTSIEAPATEPATSGNSYRWDTDKYIYNFSTKGLQPGEYRVYVNGLDDNTKPWVDLCLQK
jgi:Bacterial Ig-like domain